MANIYETLQRAAREGVYPSPAAQLIGFHLAAIEPGRATIALTADERHRNPMGTLHGGILCDIADAAMGMAYASMLGEGETFTTIEMNINFLKPVWNAKLLALGHIVKKGRTVGLVDCEITDEKGSLVARASSTLMTLRGEMARGR